MMFAVAPAFYLKIFGKLSGDKSYISVEFAKRFLKQEFELFTTIVSNMKHRFMKLTNRVLPRKGAKVETTHDQLKNISQN